MSFSPWLWSGTEGRSCRPLSNGRRPSLPRNHHEDEDDHGDDGEDEDDHDDDHEDEDDHDDDHEDEDVNVHSP